MGWLSLLQSSTSKPAPVWASSPVLWPRLCSCGGSSRWQRLSAPARTPGLPQLMLGSTPGGESGGPVGHRDRLHWTIPSSTTAPVGPASRPTCALLKDVRRAVRATQRSPATTALRSMAPSSMVTSGGFNFIVAHQGQLPCAQRSARVLWEWPPPLSSRGPLGSTRVPNSFRVHVHCMHSQPQQAICCVFLGYYIDLVFKVQFFS